MESRKKKILVTGAAGFIGKNLCEYLVKEGYKVRMMVHKTFVGPASRLDESEEVKADLTNLKSLIKITRGIDTVVNLAARKLDEKDSFEVNVEGVKNLVKACQLNSVKKIIHLSSVSAKIPKKGIYAKTKALADDIVAKSEVPYVILRVSLVYSPEPGGIFGSIVKFSKLPIIPVFGNGKWISNPIHINDLSKTIATAIENNKLQNNIWDVGGKDAIEFDDLIRKITSSRGSEPFILHIPAGIGLEIARILSIFLKNPPFTKSNILGSTQNVDIEIDKFLKNFRLKPISLNNGLKDVLSNDREVLSQEVKILAEYILSLSQVNFRPDKDFIKNYSKVLDYKKIERKDKMSSLILKLPWIIGPAEIYSKLFYKESSFLKKLMIVSALLECNPISAEWLLPKETRKVKFVAECFFIGINLTVKCLLGLILIPFLISYNKNEK